MSLKEIKDKIFQSGWSKQKKKSIWGQCKKMSAAAAEAYIKELL